MAASTNPYIPEGGFDFSTPEGRKSAQQAYYMDMAEKQGVTSKSPPWPQDEARIATNLQRIRSTNAAARANQPVAGQTGQQPGGGAAAGDEDGGTTTPSLSQVGAYDPASTQQQITGLLGSGNPYVEAARARGERGAHSRGLLNSSIAGQAGEAAAIESAFPIASQDAKFHQDMETLSRQGEIQSRLAGEQYGYDVGRIGAQETASSRLSAQDAAQQQEFERFRSEAETLMRESLAETQLSSDERRLFAEQVNQLGQQFLTEANNVQRDPEVTHSEKALVIKSLQDAYYAQLESLAAIYGIEVDWSIAPDWFDRYEDVH